MHTLGIVILQHNTPKEVTENFLALKNAELPQKTHFIVVNNGGNNANEKISKDSYKGFDVEFMDVPNKGFPQGNNLGITKTDAEYIAMVNPDIEVNKHTISTLLEYLKKNPKVGIVAPRLIYPNGQTQDNFRVFPRGADLIIKRIKFLHKIFIGRLRKYLMWDKDPSKNEPVDWVTGAFQIVTRKCWEAVGPNSEDYFLFMSDLELCRMAWEKGFEVHYVGQAQAKHNESRLSGGGFVDIFKKKTMRIHIKDALIYFKKFIGKSIPAKSPSSVDRLTKRSKRGTK
ncbi:hypothetical protein C0416_02320 [bacterium]|nr:hypothetical protein [bacterium]